MPPMNLTGAWLVWTLSLAAVGMFAWTVISWPKAAGRGWWAISRRVGTQLALVVLVVSALGAGLNREYGWYSDWADLASSFSSARPAIEVAQGGAAAAAAGQAGVGIGIPNVGTAHGSNVVAAAASLGLKSSPGPDGQYRTFQVRGSISGHTGSVTVWFPADYTSAARASHHFPVIEAFHGVPGSPAQYTGAPVHLMSTMVQQVAAGHLRDAVVVMPDYTPHQEDTECVNGTNNEPRMEDWLTEDVPHWVDTHVRVSRDRSSWATLGFSAGGWCAAMATMLHPQTYAAAIILQGYFQPTFEPPYTPFSTGSSQGRHYDLARLAHQDPPRVALWVLTSKADYVSYGTTEALLSDAKPPMSVTADVLANGGHRISVWLPFVPDALDWLGDNISGFAPIR